MRPVHLDALRIQEEAICSWNQEIASRFTVEQRVTPMTDIDLRR